MLNTCYSWSASGQIRGTPLSRQSTEVPSACLRPLRAVVVDDELMVAWALESVLEELGHEVIDIHPSGESVLSAGIADASLVIMDINLGDGIDGIAAAAKLREVASVPIIFCSAYSDQQTQEKAIVAVPDAVFVAKPLVNSDLEDAIEAVTALRH